VLELVGGVDSTLEALFSYALNVPLVLSKRISHSSHNTHYNIQITYLNVTEVVDSIATCSKYPKNFDVWMDYADTGVAVNEK